MKHLKSYIIIAILSLSFALSQNAFATATRPIKGIDVIVKKNPNGTSSRQTATPNKDGTFSVQIPTAGNYIISYADGPKRGKVIKTVTTTSARTLSVAASFNDQ